MLSQVLILYHESGRARRLGVLGPLNDKTIKNKPCTVSSLCSDLSFPGKPV